MQHKMHLIHSSYFMDRLSLKFQSNLFYHWVIRAGAFSAASFAAFFVRFFKLRMKLLFGRRKSRKQLTIITGMKILFLLNRKMFSFFLLKKKQNSVAFPAARESCAICFIFLNVFLSTSFVLSDDFVFFIVKLFCVLFSSFLAFYSALLCLSFAGGSWNGNKENRNQEWLSRAKEHNRWLAV